MCCAPALARNQDSGRILHIDHKTNTLTLARVGPHVIYRFRVSTTVTINGKEAKPSQLVAGLDVELTTNEPGVANAIVATGPLVPREHPREVTEGIINPNIATLNQLDSLPGVGPSTAAAIIKARPIRNLADLAKVKGIGPKTLERIAPSITFQ